MFRIFRCVKIICVETTDSPTSSPTDSEEGDAANQGTSDDDDNDSMMMILLGAIGVIALILLGIVGYLCCKQNSKPQAGELHPAETQMIQYIYDSPQTNVQGGTAYGAVGGAALDDVTLGQWKRTPVIKSYLKWMLIIFNDCCHYITPINS